MRNVTKTAETIIEKPIYIRLGLLIFVLRPMTMAQIYEIGSLIENNEGLDLDGEFNPIVEMLSRYKDVNTCAEVSVIMLFRSRWMRKLFGWYVKHNLTMSQYQKIIEFGAATFRAAFFLTSFSFLKGTKEMTKTTNTAKATVHGDSLDV